MDSRERPVTRRAVLHGLAATGGLVAGVSSVAAKPGTRGESRGRAGGRIISYNEPITETSFFFLGVGEPRRSFSANCVGGESNERGYRTGWIEYEYPPPGGPVHEVAVPANREFPLSPATHFRVVNAKQCPGDAEYWVATVKIIPDSRGKR